MSQPELDEAVAQILRDKVDESEVRESAGRVFANVFDSAFISADSVQKIRGCQHVQLLIPSYRSGTLTPARALLVQDHLLGCAECRRALHPQSLIVEDRQPRSFRLPFQFLAWGAAAALMVTISIGVMGASRGVLPWQHKLQATVESVQGSLYRVSNVGASLLEVGAIISNSDELRTAKGARATLRLTGGAKLELGERSDVTVDAAWNGTDVNLERGRMIVQANRTAQQKFFLISGNVVIPVYDTVLAVNHGTKGSRVSVAKGSAQVEIGGLTNALYAGQQFATSHAVYYAPIASEFDWSQNAGQYAALLNELSSLEKGIQAMPSPGLRYSSTLAQYLTANTVVYAAIPNLGASLTQAKQMFDSRLAESAVLRNWWQQQPISQNGEFDRAIDQISLVSSYLGDEIVMAMTSSATTSSKGTHPSEPVFLAKISQPGLAEYLKNNLPTGSGIHLVGSDAGAASDIGGLFIEADNGVLVASLSPERVQQVESTLRAPSGSQFTATPLFARVQEVYGSGAGYFLAAELEQMLGKSVNSSKGQIPPGLDKAQFLVLERKDISGTTQMRASLSFDGSRQGIASWLAAPGPAGSLDFVSPQASLAVSVVMKNPRAMMQELIGYGSGANRTFEQNLTEFETKAGVSLLDDVAAPLGSDLTFAVDGPGLPGSAWKVALEVYNPQRLQQTLATVVDCFNQQAVLANAGKLQLTNHPAGDLVFYSLSNSKLPAFTVSYTFVDGYLLAAGSEANLLATIQNKRAGQTLVTSAAFRSKLPADGYTDFSGLFYQNVGQTLGPLVDQMRNVNGLSAQQRQALSAIAVGGGPGLICLYGERNRIVAASTGSFLGFDLGTLADVYQGKSFVPLIASNSAPLRSKVVKPN